MGYPSRTAAPTHGDSVKPPRNPMLQMVQGFAGGGALDKTLDAVQKRSEALKEIDSDSSATPTPSSAPAKPSMGSEADNYAAQAAQIEADQQAAARAKVAPKPKTWRERLGFQGGGKIEGPGTPTSDSIGATVTDTGDNIRVSTDERIVSAEQDAFLERLAKDLGFENLDAMLEQATGKPVGPTLKAGTPAAALGASTDDLKNVLNTSAVPGVARAGNSFSQDLGAAPKENVLNRVVSGSAQVAALPSGAGGAAEIRNTPVATTFVQPAPVATPPKNPLLQSTRDFSMPEGNPVPFTPRVEPAATVQRPAFQAGDASMKAADPQGYAAVASQQPGAQERTFGAPSPSASTLVASAPSSEPITNPLALSAETPKPTSSPATPPAITPAESSQTAPFKSRVGNSFTERNTVMDKSNPLTTIDLAASNASLAKANAIRQELIDAQAGGVTSIGNSGLAETNALMDKWGREDAAKAAIDAAIANPRSAQAIASVHGAVVSGDSSRNRDAVELSTRAAADATSRRGQDTRLQETAMHNSTIERGQDIAARTHAAQLAGNPLDNALKQTSIDMNKSALTRAQAQDKMVADISAEQDPERRRALMDTLLSSQGKNPSEHRYIKVEGGEEMGPDGFTKIKRPSGVYDTVSGRFIAMDGGSSPAPAQVPQGAIDLLRKNPSLAADFDKKFGAGSASKILGK